jgi:predicted GIY-YIG superfamily endonuclease
MSNSFRSSLPLKPRRLVVAVLMILASWRAPPVHSAASAAESGTQQDRSELIAAVRLAFRETHDGWSADEVLVHDQRNAAFLKRCRERLPETPERDFNWTLLNPRKADTLRVKATRRAPMRHDDYFHAAEIAARFLHDKYGQSIDRILCDPQRRREFDTAARATAPGVSAYRLRKAALSLRKARRLRPELVVRVADWDKRVLTLPAERIAEDADSVPCQPGIYIFRDTSGYLYVGESADLRDRLAKHLDGSDRHSLARYFADQGIDDVTVEIHAFAPDSNGRRVAMRRAYESELIRSRKPRFNLAP